MANDQVIKYECTTCDGSHTLQVVTEAEGRPWNMACPECAHLKIDALVHTLEQQRQAWIDVKGLTLVMQGNAEAILDIVARESKWAEEAVEAARDG